MCNHATGVLGGIIADLVCSHPFVHTKSLPFGIGCTLELPYNSAMSASAGSDSFDKND
jgi:hypothetical protein